MHDIKIFHASSAPELVEKYSEIVNERTETIDGGNLYKICYKNLIKSNALVALYLEEEMHVKAGAYGVIDGIGDGYLCGVVCLPDTRGKGISKICVKLLIEKLFEVGVRRVFLSTRPQTQTGEIAHRIYSSLGFKTVSINKVVVSNVFEDRHLAKHADGFNNDGKPFFNTEVMMLIF